MIAQLEVGYLVEFDTGETLLGNLLQKFARIPQQEWL